MIRHPDRVRSEKAVPPSMAVLAVAIAVVSLLGIFLDQAEAASNPTDGRLGGTYASFIGRFGEPTEQIGGLGLLFQHPGTGYVAVQFDSSDNEYELGDPALVITVSADRDESRPADEADPGDWTWTMAQTIAADLSPTDAVFAAVDDSVPGSRSTTCSSDALLEAFGVVSLGECRATYVLSSDETVSFVTLTLTSGAETRRAESTPETACAGVVAWAKGSADRLDTARTLLDTLATLSDDPTVAVPDLRELAEELDALADEQRAVAAPIEIAAANYYIIGALTDFSTAIELAADGLEQSDQTMVDEAVDDLDAADARAARASTEIESAVFACDLTTGTPVAG